MRAAIIGWARARWRGARVIHELACGERRTDLVVVAERDLVAFEIKSSVDTLARLEDQVKEFGRYFPEVWVAIAPRWMGDVSDMHLSNVMIVDVDHGTLRIPNEMIVGWRPQRDELVYSRLLELLWMEEAQRIAQRTGVIPGAPTHQMRSKTLPMLARLLTGNDILREVCAELRQRPLVGVGSDPPVSATPRGRG